MFVGYGTHPLYQTKEKWCCTAQVAANTGLELRTLEWRSIVLLRTSGKLPGGCSFYDLGSSAEICWTYYTSVTKHESGGRGITCL